MFNRRQLLAAPALLLTAPALLLANTARAEQRFPSLSMFIPAGPGGGWDGLGRAIEQVSRQAGLVGTFQFENIGGAGGTVGLPRFVASKRGRGDALMVSGSIMVGSVLTNKTPVGLQNVTPVARLTAELVALDSRSSVSNLAVAERIGRCRRCTHCGRPHSDDPLTRFHIAGDRNQNAACGSA
jgi:putative tricarboxylic transport membrane protein